MTRHRPGELWVGVPMHLVIGTTGLTRTVSPGHAAVYKSRYETACGLEVSHVNCTTRRADIGRWPHEECCRECIAYVIQTTHRQARQPSTAGRLVDAILGLDTSAIPGGKK